MRNDRFENFNRRPGHPHAIIGLRFVINSAELQMLRNADGGAVLPGIDTQAGNPLSASALIDATTRQTGAGSPYFYDPKNDRVVVTKDGADLNGVNFAGWKVEIRANNVTIEDSNFSSPVSNASIQVDAGFSGAVVTDNTFDSQLVPGAAAWIHSVGLITVANNKFIDSPSDAIDLESGVVSGNYIEGVGNASNGAHADAIWVTNSSGPTTISNNLIDWVADGTESLVNNTVRITTEEGSVSNVTVTGNYLLGGSYTIDAGNSTNAGRTYSNINIDNNYIGFGLYGAFYPGAQSGVTESGNTVFDFTNPIYSTEAWTAYVAAGIPTAQLVTSTGADIKATTTSPTTLYGAGYMVHMFGGVGETNFVGGFGRQYMFSGPGASIFTELAVSDSSASSADYIAAFNPAKDVIDLSHIDASLTAPGQSFTFIGTAPFSGGSAQVRYQQDPANDMTYVEADLAGELQARCLYSTRRPADADGRQFRPDPRPVERRHGQRSGSLGIDHPLGVFADGIFLYQRRRQAVFVVPVDLRDQHDYCGQRSGFQFDGQRARSAQQWPDDQPRLRRRKRQGRDERLFVGLSCERDDRCERLRRRRLRLRRQFRQ